MTEVHRALHSYPTKSSWPILRWYKNCPINCWTSFQVNLDSKELTDIQPQILNELRGMNFETYIDDIEGRIRFFKKNIEGSIGIFDNGIVDVQRLSEDGLLFFDFYRDFLLRISYLCPLSVE